MKKKSINQTLAYITRYIAPYLNAYMEMQISYEINHMMGRGNFDFVDAEKPALEIERKAHSKLSDIFTNHYSWATLREASLNNPKYGKLLVEHIEETYDVDGTW